MDFQILLLPEREYWSWVRACREYVLTFGPNLTSDPHTAAKYMYPRQVVTFPVGLEGFPALGDLERWFQEEHPGIRLDPVQAVTPDEMESALAQRIEEDDRYGHKQREFYLLWPTDYALVTQEFGVNPRVYARWGFPGHEGVDIRARTNTNIYACADGEVYRVHTNPRNHPYGIHVRIRHAHGYKTVYGHFAKALVREGQTVKAGEVIGKSDATGASTGSHLHLTLKRDGATARGETAYPKDVLDPTPFLIWPSFVAGKTLAANVRLPEHCLVGAHGRVGGGLEPSDVALIRAARLEALKLECHESSESVHALQTEFPHMFLMVRLCYDFSSEPVSPSEFVSSVHPRIQSWTELNVEHFELLSNPNVQNHGWRRSWAGGGEFAAWFLEVSEMLRRDYPDASFGFPGLAPGGYIAGWREEWARFLEDADQAVGVSDWVGVNCAWTDYEQMGELTGGRLYEEYRTRYPEKPIYITEFTNPDPYVTPEIKGLQYVEYGRRLRDVPGIGGAFAFALSAVEGYDHIVWRGTQSDGVEIARLFAQRAT